MDFAGAGRRNDQDLADARCCPSAAEPRPAGAVRIARIHPCQATPDEIRGNLGIHWHGRANAGCSPQIAAGCFRAAGEGTLRLLMAVADTPNLPPEPHAVIRHAGPHLCGYWRCRHRHQGGAANGAAGRRQRSASGPWQAPAGARRPLATVHRRLARLSSRRPVLTEAVFLAAQLSRSRPPRLGRSVRSRVRCPAVPGQGIQ
jgi:hypothetical protein